MVRAGRECGWRASFVFIRWVMVEHVCLLMAMISSEGEKWS